MRNGYVCGRVTLSQAMRQRRIPPGPPSIVSESAWWVDTRRAWGEMHSAGQPLTVRVQEWRKAQDVDNILEKKFKDADLFR